MAQLLAHAWRPALAAAAAKLLLAPAYHSTDYEVHRHWTALTAALPPSRWYHDETSVWTLDYPPLFAWWQWALARVARVLAPGALTLSATPVDSPAIAAFMRGSVVATDTLLCGALVAFWAAASPPVAAARGSAGGAARAATTSSTAITAATTTTAAATATAALFVLANFGLILVDDIHFQYNGLLVAVLLASLAAARAGRGLLAAALFAALLHLKHAFVYAAPAFGMYLLRTHVLHGGGAPATQQWPRALARALALLAVAAAVSALSLGPVLAGSMRRNGAQLLARLFPFSRGLVHAYWAPNAWAVYMAADKVAAAVCRRLVSSRAARAYVAAVCSGVTTPHRHADGQLEPQVGGGGGEAAAFASAAAAAAAPPPLHNRLLVLPRPTPAVTAVLVLLALLPLLAAMWHAGGAEDDGQQSGNEGEEDSASGSSSVASSHPVARLGGWPQRLLAALAAPARFSTTLAGSARLRAALPVCVAISLLLSVGLGYHVHEKAALYATLPLWAAVGASLLRLPPPPPSGVAGEGSSGAPSHGGHRRSGSGGADDAAAALARITWALSLPVHYALTPLVFTPREQPLVALGLAGFTLWSWGALRAAHGPRALRCDFGARGGAACLPLWEQLYLAGFLPLHGVVLAHPLLLPALPSLHLALVSLYCTVGVAVGTVRLYGHALRLLLPPPHVAAPRAAAMPATERFVGRRRASGA